MSNNVPNGRHNKGIIQYFYSGEPLLKFGEQIINAFYGILL